MQFKDLLRGAVLLIAGVATALGAIGIVGADAADDTLLLLITGGWWLMAIGIGAWLGRPERNAEAVRKLLADARTADTLPAGDPARIAFARLWPVIAFAIAAGGLGVVYPQVASIGAGYALLVALAWRRREAALTAVEERDGICFYVEPGNAFEPVKLIRAPGLRRD